MNNIEQVIAAFITESLLLGKRIDVKDITSFLDAGIIDSTGVLELVQFIEDTWDISVKDEEMIAHGVESVGVTAHGPGASIGDRRHFFVEDAVAQRLCCVDFRGRVGQPDLEIAGHDLDDLRVGNRRAARKRAPRALGTRCVRRMRWRRKRM